MAITLADVLDPRRVVLQLRATVSKDALREIVDAMQAESTLRDPEKFVAEVCAREEVHTTYMGDGVAFPHARTDLVEEILLGIGRSTEGIPLGENGERAQLIFLIAVPRRMVNDYLICVGALARLTRDSAMREKLMSAKTAQELVGILREGSLVLE